jgi:hypothetical protein
MLLALALAGALAPEASRAAPADDAVRAGVPAGLAAEVATRAAGAGLDPALALEPVVRAARADVPAELVATKVLEGLSKGVPPPRVLSVAGALASRLVDASALLGEARDAKLPLRSPRAAVLADLAAALGEGVQREAIRDLFRAAAAGKGGSADAAVAAARTLGDLAHRGVKVGDAFSLAAALAAHPPLPSGQVASLYDAYREEGGRDPRPFLEEAERRTAAGAPLAGMIDYFGDDREPVVKLKKTAAPSAGQDDVLDRSGRTQGAGEGSGTVPGLEDGSPGRGRKKQR